MINLCSRFWLRYFWGRMSAGGAACVKLLVSNCGRRRSRLKAGTGAKSATKINKHGRRINRFMGLHSRQRSGQAGGLLKLIRRQTEMADEGCIVISLSHLPLADERGASRAPSLRGS